MLGTLLAIAVALQSPPSETQAVAVGVRLGLDRTAIPYSVYEHTGTGGVVGAHASVPIWQHLSVQPEISFASKEFVLSYRNTDRVRASFLELAALAVVPTADQPPYLFVGAGPALAFRVGGIPRVTPPYGSQPDDWRRADVEVVVAGGILAKVSERTRFRLDVRYVHGLLDLDPDVDHSDPRVRTWQFGCAVEWRSKR